MDFDQAIAAHSGWKRKLTTYLKNPDKSLKHLDIAQANKCDLGQWLDGEGKKFADRPEFVKRKTDHMRFHKVAAASGQPGRGGFRRRNLEREG